MKTPPKNNNALFCQKHNRAKSDSRFSAAAVWIHGYGGNTSYLLRGFSHPDFTVGFGFSPNQRISAVEDLRILFDHLRCGISPPLKHIIKFC